MIGYYLSRAVSALIGTLYPGYYSYKAIKEKDTDAVMRWMKYWTVFAFFTALEAVFDLFIFWLPFYYETKTVFVLFLLLPQTRGADYVFQHILLPTLATHEGNIDDTLRQAETRAKKHARDAWEQTRSSISTAVMASIAKAAEVAKSESKTRRQEQEQEQEQGQGQGQGQVDAGAKQVGGAQGREEEESQWTLVTEGTQRTSNREKQRGRKMTLGAASTAVSSSADSGASASRRTTTPSRRSARRSAGAGRGGTNKSG